MAKIRKIRINCALDMQREIEELFFLAKMNGDIKQAAYLCQVWISCEGYAEKAREKTRTERTSLDDLVDILGDMRAQYIANTNNITEEENNE